MGLDSEKFRRAFAETCEAFQLNTVERIMLAILVGILAIAVVWIVGGKAQGWEEFVAKMGSSAAIVLLFPVVYCWKLFAPRDRARRARMTSLILIIAGFVITASGLLVIGIGLSQVQQNRPEQAHVASEKHVSTDQKLTAAERKAAERSAFLRQRNTLEEPLENVDGTLAVYEFPEKGMGKVEIADGNAAYTVHMTVAGGTSVWIYDENDSIRSLYKIGRTARGELIDLQMFQAAQRSEHLEIGEAAVLEAADGKLIQILIVGVRYYRSGDADDKVRLRYKIHLPDEQPLKAL